MIRIFRGISIALFIVPSLVHAATFVITCHISTKVAIFNVGGQDVSIQINTDPPTANGNPAVITEKSIEWVTEGSKGERYDLSIDRYIGSLRIVRDHKVETGSGKCSKVDDKKF
jgi:hypothetical protein